MFLPVRASASVLAAESVRPQRDPAHDRQQPGIGGDRKATKLRQQTPVEIEP
jgi:hypothetical protein